MSLRHRAVEPALVAPMRKKSGAQNFLALLLWEGWGVEGGKVTRVKRSKVR